MKVRLITLDDIECDIEIPGIRPLIERPIYKHRYGKYGECDSDDLPVDVNPLRTRLYEYSGENFDGRYVYREKEMSSDWAAALGHLKDIISKARAKS